MQKLLASLVAGAALALFSSAGQACDFHDMQTTSTQAEPVVAIDGSGNSLVFGSRTIDPSASVPSYAMTAGYRAAGAATWQVQGLDTSGGPALASAAFDTSGNAFVVWRPNLSGGNSIVYGTRRSAGAWETPTALSDVMAVDTRFPRVSVDGRALLLFEQKFSSADPFKVYSRLWKQGLWSDISAVQNDANEGRFADCPRNANLSDNFEIAWRETDPADATQFRVMSSFVQLGP